MTEINEQLSTLSPNTQHNSEPTTIRMKYYDLKKNWHRIKPHLEDKELNDILVRDFNKFTFGRWNHPFTYATCRANLNPATGTVTIQDHVEELIETFESHHSEVCRRMLA